MSRGAAQVRTGGRIPFRADIEGMRGAALAFALAAHGGVPVLSGGFIGIDMFFVISGFLITGLLVAEAEGSGRIKLGRFYAQRMKRLLPLAALVLFVTAVGSILLFSPPQRELVSRDLLGAALHIVNWQFAAQSVDYFGPETAASPVMHYWSLSIEEQFYLVWALLLVGVTWWCRRRGHSLRILLLVTVASIGALSFLYSVTYSPEAPNAAYFSTFTRAWQLAAGALLALIAWPTISRRWAQVLSILGVALIAYAVLGFDAAMAYPGAAGLVPVLGTAALILAGLSTAKTTVRRFLEVPAMVYLGGISYAWYLWHYPVMIFGIAAWGPLQYAETTALVLLAGIPAIISHHLVGQPLRYSRNLTRFPARAVAVGATCTVVAVGSAGALAATTPKVKPPPASEVEGASSLRSPTLQRSAKAVRPAPTSKDARGDRGAVWDEGCMLQPEETESKECVFGQPAGRTTVVLFGDSHAMHFFTAVEHLAERRDWRLIALTKAGCPPFDVLVYNSRLGRAHDECRTWHEKSLERIESVERPALIITAGALSHSVIQDGKQLNGSENIAKLEAGYERMLGRLVETGARVVALKDLPKAPHDMTDCVAEHLDDLAKCAYPEDGDELDHFDVRAAKRVEGVELIDLSPAICSEGTCFGVIGDALVYRDNDHMTATFATTLAPWLGRELNRDR